MGHRSFLSVLMIAILIFTGFVMVPKMTIGDPEGEPVDGPVSGPMASESSDLPPGPTYNGDTLHVGAGQTYSTIQAALSDSSDGDTIMVHPGKYQENLAVPASVRIEGMDGAILDGSGNQAMLVLVQNVTVVGMEIRNSSIGVYSLHMGLNLTGNMFVTNILHVRVEVINGSLLEDFTGYPIVIWKNEFTHSSTSGTVDVDIDLGSSIEYLDIDVGSVWLVKNKATNSQTRGYIFAIDERVSQLYKGSLSFDVLNINGNDLTGGDQGIRIVRILSDLTDTGFSIADTMVHDNNITGPRSRGIHLGSSFSPIGGNSSGTLGDQSIEGNMITSNSISAQGIFAGPFSFIQNTENASIIAGNLSVAGNKVNVRGIALSVNFGQSFYNMFDDTKAVFGEVRILGNNLTSRSSQGISYYSTGRNYYGGSRSVLEGVRISWNLISSFREGVIVSLPDLGIYLVDDAEFIHGDLEISNNNITTVIQYGISISVQGFGNGLYDNSHLSLGRFLILNNSIYGSNGITLKVLDSFRTSYGSSISEFSGAIISNNTVKGNGVGIDVSMSNDGESLTGHSKLSIGPICIDENIMDIQGDGIRLNMDTVGSDMYDWASFIFNGISVDDNRIYSIARGLYIPTLRFIGWEMYNDSKASIGSVSISDNIISSPSEVDIGGIGSFGCFMYGSSRFDMGDIDIVGNDVTTASEGISIGQISELGCYLWDDASSTIGNISIDDNDIDARDALIIDQLNFIGYVINDASSSVIGEISVDGNYIDTDGEGIKIRTINDLVSSLSVESKTYLNFLSISGNIIKSVGYGIYLDNIETLSSFVSGKANGWMGEFRISDNSIASLGPGGIYIDTVMTIGSDNRGSSVVYFGGFVFDNNSIESRIGIDVQSMYLIGSHGYDDSSTIIGDITFDGNRILSEAPGIAIHSLERLGSFIADKATVDFGRISFGSNMIISNDTGILLFLFQYLFSFNSGNGTVTIDELSVDHNDIECKGGGIYFQDLILGYDNDGDSFFQLDRLSVSGNSLRCTYGIRIAPQFAQMTGRSQNILASFAMDGNSLIGSDENGLYSHLILNPTGMSSLTLGAVTFSDNDVHDVNYSALYVRFEEDVGPDSKLTIDSVKMVHNNLTGNGVGLNLTGARDSRVYLNNFIGNTIDVELKDSVTTWFSAEKIWYRHGMSNFSNHAGNYWDRYTGSDTNDDGIGDTPYNTGFGLDLYPFTKNVDELFPPWNDNTPPSVRILEPTDGSFLNTTDVRVTWEGEDDLLGIVKYIFILDDGYRHDKGLDTFHDCESLTEGIHNATVVAMDKAGNFNVTTVLFTIDLSDPEVSITEPLDGEYINSDTIVVKWTGSDLISGIERYLVRMDEGPIQDLGLSNSLTLEDLAEGEHSISLIAYDLAGNQKEESVTFFIDTIPPSLTIESPEEGGYYNTVSINISWNISEDNPLGSRISLDEDEPVDIGSAKWYLFEDVGDGSHTVTVTAIDRALNLMTASVSFTIDTEDPIIDIIQPKGILNTSDVRVVLKANGTGSPLAGISYSLDGGEVVPAMDLESSGNDHTFWIEDISEGSHSLSIRALDQAGNQREMGSTFTIDSLAPIVLWASPNGTGVRTDSRLNVAFSEGMDHGSLILDAGASGTLEWDGNSIRYDFETLLEPGQVYDMTVVGSDLAGNRLEFQWQFTTAITGTIIGKVSNGKGDPVKGANIQLDTGETVRTEMDGSFSIQAQQGARTVKIIVDDKVLTTFTVDVIAGATSDSGNHEVDLPSKEGRSYWLWIVLFIVLVLVSIAIIAFIVIRSRRPQEDIWGE